MLDDIHNHEPNLTQQYKNSKNIENSQRGNLRLLQVTTQLVLLNLILLKVYKILTSFIVLDLFVHFFFHLLFKKYLEQLEDL